MSDTNILVTGKDIEEPYLERLRQQGFMVENPQEHLSEDDVIKCLVGKHAYLLAGLERATPRIIKSTKGLKLIAFLGVGYQSFVDEPQATSMGIAITNTPGAMVSSVAEMTVGHLLALRRRIPHLNQAAKQGKTIEEKAHDLEGETLGIIGMGMIGSRVAHMLRAAFGMNVQYYSRSAKPDVESSIQAARVGLDELLRTSDVVSLHVPTTEETKGLIDESKLQLMKRSAVLINTARAEIVDGHALYRALTDGVIAGAAFDGYYIEPLPDKKDDSWKLLSIPDEKFLVTPHVASLTDNSWNRMTEMSISSIENFFKSGDDSHIVNPAFRTHLK